MWSDGIFISRLSLFSPFVLLSFAARILEDGGVLLHTPHKHHSSGVALYNLNRTSIESRWFRE